MKAGNFIEVLGQWAVDDCGRVVDPAQAEAILMPVS
jgi:CO/xanthine dehydrogenase Mo-binding subunit